MMMIIPKKKIVKKLIIKKNYKLISPNNLAISPTSSNEIKYDIKNIENNDSKYEDEQSQRINKLINSIRTNQNSIRKSYGMIDDKINNSKNNTNMHKNKNKNKKNSEYNEIIRTEENKNLYYITTNGNCENEIEIEMNKYTLMFFCYLISHYMKKKVFLGLATKIADYQKYLEKKFSLKILYRVLKKRIIFYKIKFMHRYKKIYKYLYKNNIDTITQVYSEESSRYIFDSEKYNNRFVQNNNKYVKENRNVMLEKNKKNLKGNKKINKKYK